MSGPPPAGCRRRRPDRSPTTTGAANAVIVTSASKSWNLAALKAGLIVGDPAVLRRLGPMQDLVTQVVRQRLSLHRHPGAVADALVAVPRSKPFGSIAELSSIQVPVLVVGDRDELDPGHPLAIAEQWAAAIPGAGLLVEPPGQRPLAWQGGAISRAIAQMAEDEGLR